jgi:hypothetical protein
MYEPATTIANEDFINHYENPVRPIFAANQSSIIMRIAHNVSAFERAHRLCLVDEKVNHSNTVIAKLRDDFVMNR